MCNEGDWLPGRILEQGNTKNPPLGTTETTSYNCRPFERDPGELCDLLFLEKSRSVKTKIAIPHNSTQFHILFWVSLNDFKQNVLVLFLHFLIGQRSLNNILEDIERVDATGRNRLSAESMAGR